MEYMATLLMAVPRQYNRRDATGGRRRHDGVTRAACVAAASSALQAMVIKYFRQTSGDIANAEAACDVYFN